MDNTHHNDVIDLGIASVETLGQGPVSNDTGGIGLQQAGILAE